MKKIIYIAVVVVLIILAVIIWERMAIPVAAPASAPGANAVSPTSSDSVQAIQSDINNVSVGNVDQQFQGIDQGINSL
jgi:uncharacterized protein YxeA